MDTELSVDHVDGAALSRKMTVTLRRIVRLAMLNSGIHNNAALGEFLGLSHRSIYNFMRAERARPTLPLLTALAVKFNISFITLLCLAAPQATLLIRQLALPSGIAAADSYRQLQRAHAELCRYLERHPPTDPALDELASGLVKAMTELTNHVGATQRPEADYETLYAYWRLLPEAKRDSFRILLDIPTISDQD